MYLFVLNIPLQFSHFIYLRFQKVFEKNSNCFIVYDCVCVFHGFSGAFHSSFNSQFPALYEQCAGSTRLDSLLAWRALRHLSAPKLYFIKAHKVTFRRRCPNLPHQHGLSPSRYSLSFYSFLAHSRATYDCGRQHKKFGETKQSWQHTHTQHTHTLAAVAEHYPFAADSGNGYGYGSCCLVPPALAAASAACCLLPLPLSCCDACGVRLVLCMRGGFCLCDNRIYCFIKFVFKLPLPAVPHQLPLCLSLCLPLSLSSAVPNYARIVLRFQ